MGPVTLIFFSFFLLIIIPSSHGDPSTCNSPPEIIKGGYFPSWFALAPTQINTKYFTHAYYAFLAPDNSTFNFTIDPSLADSLRTFTSALKTNDPPVDPLFSIGGGDVDATLFPRMASTKKTRAAFIQSAISVARAHGFCGMDLDYEYPHNPKDMKNLGHLLQEWRKAVDSEANHTGLPPLLITAAVYYSSGPFFSGIPRFYPVKSITKNLDWVNMMDYDYHGAWEPSATGAHAQLYDPTGGNLSTSHGIESWIGAGVPPCMLMMGIPLYARTWKLKNKRETWIGAPATGVGPGDQGIMIYAKVVEFNKKNKAKEVFDTQTVSVYSVAGNNWIGYDDVRSVTVKIQFAKKQNLGGYFFWALGYDYKWTISENASVTWDASS